MVHCVHLLVSLFSALWVSKFCGYFKFSSRWVIKSALKILYTLIVWLLCYEVLAISALMVANGHFFCLCIIYGVFAFSVWHCQLGVRKSIRPVKKSSVELVTWLSVRSEVQMICVWSSWCHCHCIISCFIIIQIGLTFQVPPYPGCLGKEAIKPGVYLSLCP